MACSREVFLWEKQNKWNKENGDMESERGKTKKKRRAKESEKIERMKVKKKSEINWKKER
jgi:hypothetical protein